MMKASLVLLSLSILCCSTVQAFQSVHSQVQRKVSLLQSSVLENIETTEGKTATTRDLPPLLQTLADERREYELNLGKAMDTLRKDYPTMLHKTPDFSIYNEQIRVLDPSGVQLTGLKNYKHSFTFLQTLVRFFYNTDASTVQSRMIYDFARQSIRISWNAILVPKVVGNRRNALYVDGVSVYKMDMEGNILEHKVENMVMNGTPVVPPYGVFSALREEVLHGQRIPVGVGVGVGAMFKQ